MIYVVTDEEDQFIRTFQKKLSKFEKQTWVYNAALGLVPIGQLTKDWQNRAHQEIPATMSIHEALIQIYKNDPQDGQHFYIITDPERWLRDEHVQRRILNVAHQLHNNIKVVKLMIFVGPRKYIPEKLSRYIEVVNERGLTPEEITELATETCTRLKIDVPEDAPRIFQGLTHYECISAIAQSYIKTRKTTRKVDPAYIAQFKRNQIKKTDLLQFVDTTTTFDDVGGNDRFKEWALETKAAWTEQGRAYGLKPPKGVLAVGVWGCGKSLSVKAMGSAWNLPVVQLEMGKLRSSGVGESEANVYRATRLIEAIAPCIVWVDEAEKSLAGNASSGQSDAGTTSRTIGILSTWLQETTAPICMAMTANSLTTMPVEFVNRMDERFFFDIPSEEERMAILKIHLRKAGQSPDNYDLATLAEKSNNMVGREIEQAIQAAMIKSFNAKKPSLDEGILIDVFAHKPRILRTMADEMKAITEWVGYDPDAQEGIRARLASGSRSASFRVVNGS
jgi:SpoVK/Ycf46/Vps4 family AAA+-type ATPase